MHESSSFLGMKLDERGSEVDIPNVTVCRSPSPSSSETTTDLVVALTGNPDSMGWGPCVHARRAR